MSSSSDVATTEFSTLYATFPNETHAHSLARNLVEERMANFVNVMPTMKTVYREAYGDDVLTDNEVLLIAKIRTADASRVVDFVAEKSQVEESEIYTMPVSDPEPSATAMTSILPADDSLERIAEELSIVHVDLIWYQ